ncbi:DNA-3-methyladenine glycosidase [Pleomorphomonas diazotrophica]|uniref:DNA-3-methyladenine glycosylase II n=1 Tax=Pleomorphomonas diazotrophica TaxID=1166257 RepID=A0A1I4RSV7_9HYPH|nr:DNA-3-methyladenine glycosylase [Pleomorphomonas diazotrophica]PKR88075.1 DNA-3-methyladenine glycosidase [Pleomorphomonas diazotrophica]SFM55362.1 DNA-3-methyladenine glycosylase II [Pleomorphomonas diazotrophica]
MRLILSDADMVEGLDYLERVDPRLVPVRAIAGPVDIRYRPPGFEGIARIVVAQQLSVSSADAIWGRFEALLGAATAVNYLRQSEEALRAAGLSRGKVRTLSALAEAEVAGLDLAGLADESPEAATEKLMAIHGIGRWTAEIFLLFCARHADVLPAGDLALQVAAAEALALQGRPTEKELRAISELWSPWRGVAAKLLWAYYKAMRQGRNVLPV